MAEQTIVGALLLGVLEGLTEFIPVSSTGHLLLAGHFLGFRSTGKHLRSADPAGAPSWPSCLSISSRLLAPLPWTFPTSPKARRFVLAVLLAFLPAAVIGVLAHSFIKTVLFETPALICIVLIIGGFILTAVDRMKRPSRATTTSWIFRCRSRCKIGIIQCLAMIPGTSRSGATIAGALLLGTDKRSAAEFSFFLAMPTMAGAFAYDLYQNYDRLSARRLHNHRRRFYRGIHLRGVRRARHCSTLCRNYGFTLLCLVAHRGRHGRTDRPLFFLEQG